MKRKNIYPALVIGLLAGFLLFAGWSARQAVVQGPQIADRDYYSKGLKYNTTLLEKRAASVLGWQLDSSFEQGLLQIRLADRHGQHVVGARGQLTFFHHSDRRNSSLQLNESVPGTYQVQLPDSLQGEVTLRIAFERDGARIHRQLLLSI